MSNCLIHKPGDRQSLRTSRLSSGVIGREHFAPDLLRNFSEELASGLGVAEAVVIHKVSHNIADGNARGN